jgi:hypothetical protein
VKTFHLGDVLSVTTERLVSPDGIEGIYRILNHMTGDDLMTHVLPRANDACRPVLLAQHPQLAAAKPPPEGFENPAHVWRWLAVQVAMFGERLGVAPMTPGQWAHRDPIGELVDMVGADRVVGVKHRAEGIR